MVGRPLIVTLQISFVDDKFIKAIHITLSCVFMRVTVCLEECRFRFQQCTWFNLDNYHLMIINAQTSDPLLYVMCIRGLGNRNVDVRLHSIDWRRSLYYYPPSIDFSGMWNVCMCMLIKRH